MHTHLSPSWESQTQLNLLGKTDCMLQWALQETSKQIAGNNFRANHEIGIRTTDLEACIGNIAAVISEQDQELASLKDENQLLLAKIGDAENHSRTLTSWVFPNCKSPQCNYRALYVYSVWATGNWEGLQGSRRQWDGSPIDIIVKLLYFCNKVASLLKAHKPSLNLLDLAKQPLLLSSGDLTGDYPVYHRCPTHWP